LFIDARRLGVLVDRTHRELTPEEIAWIAGAYHAWRGEKDSGKYGDMPGFSKSATIDEIKQLLQSSLESGYILRVSTASPRVTFNVIVYRVETAVNAAYDAGL
jgi:type I restriction-modification system DNA methylase subunit